MGGFGFLGFSKSFSLLVDVVRYFLENVVLMLVHYSGGAVFLLSTVGMHGRRRVPQAQKTLQWEKFDLYLKTKNFRILASQLPVRTG